MFRLASFTDRALKDCTQENKRGVSVCPGRLRSGEERREPCVPQRRPRSRDPDELARDWQEGGHRGAFLPPRT